MLHIFSDAYLMVQNTKLYSYIGMKMDKLYVRLKCTIHIQEC